ncbi:hypothetical protein M0804_010105 [Polistes exclamans]|nr:hypothetical protein M0804_010105 [Polistes exclamans]
MVVVKVLEGLGVETRHKGVNCPLSLVDGTFHPCDVSLGSWDSSARLYYGPTTVGAWVVADRIENRKKMLNLQCKRVSAAWTKAWPGNATQILKWHYSKDKRSTSIQETFGPRSLDALLDHWPPANRIPSDISSKL